MDSLSKAYDLECHSGGLNDAVYGAKTDLIVTAGRDRTISLWSFTNPTLPVVRVATTTNPESLELRHDNRILAYGSMSGSVKLWDCESEQNVASFHGHTCNVRVLCSSPANVHMWASGSLDSTIRLWDARQQSSIATYKVHAKTVTALQFSPHGAWLTTGSADCTVKLLDIPAGGASRAEMTGHSGPISDVRFHPTDFLLASASLDKTVRFWDLESFECVSQSDSAGGTVEKIRFYPVSHSKSNDNGLFAASEKGLRLLGWEPARIYRFLSASEHPVDWPPSGGSNVLDLGFRDGAGQGVCFCRSADRKLAVFTVDIGKLRPFSPVPIAQEEEPISEKPSDGEFQAPKSLGNIPKREETGTRICQGEPTPLLERAKRIRRSFHDQKPIKSSNDPSPELSSSESTENSPQHRSNRSEKLTINKCTGLNGEEVVVMGDPNKLLTNFTNEEDVFKPRPKVRVSPPLSPTPMSSCAAGDDTSSLSDNNGYHHHHHKNASTSSVPLGTAFDLPSVDPLGMTFTVTAVEQSEPGGLHGTGPKGGRVGSVKRSSPLTTRKSLSTSKSFSSNSASSIGVSSVKKPTKAVAPQPVVSRKSSVGTDSANIGFGGSQKPVLPPQRNASGSSCFHQSDSAPQIEPFGRGDFCGGNTYLVDSIEDSSSLFPDNDGNLSSADWLRPQDFLTNNNTFNDQFASLSLASTSTRSTSISNRPPSVSQSPRELNALNAVHSDSQAMSAVLQVRMKHLEVARRTWKERGLRQGVEMGLSVRDPTGSLVVDLLKVVNSNSSNWSLDMCVSLLPEIKSLLTSTNGKREPYVKVAGESLRLILQGYGDVIRSGTQAIPSIGTDVEGEARVDKCRKCASSLEGIRIAVAQKQKQQSLTGGLSQAYRELGILMQL